jgi:hypothetical protein
VGLTAVLGGASSAVGQTGVEGRCGGITGSLVLVLAMCMGGGGGGGPQSMCELSGGERDCSSILYTVKKRCSGKL